MKAVIERLETGIWEQDIYGYAVLPDRLLILKDKEDFTDGNAFYWDDFIKITLGGCVFFGTQKEPL